MQWRIYTGRRKSTSKSVTNEKDNEGGERRITQDTDGLIVVSTDGIYY